MWGLESVTDIFMEETTPILHKLLQKTEESVTCPNSLYEVNVTLILKPKTLQEKKNNHKPIFIMNIDANFL